MTADSLIFSKKETLISIADNTTPKKGGKSRQNSPNNKAGHLVFFQIKESLSISLQKQLTDSVTVAITGFIRAFITIWFILLEFYQR